MTQSIPEMRPRALQWSAIIGLVILGSAAPHSAWSQTADSLDLPPTVTRANPFSGFETHYLSNGLKVWFKRMPEAPNVSISVGVPYGWDADPRRKEELAHLTEHILFSDREGQTEEEIKDAIDAIGGRRNGFTTPDHTWYYVTVAKEHGPFALEWLSRVVSPPTVNADLVERNRVPVALEINAQPREFFESLWATLNPSWLVPPDFWRRELGMKTRDDRRYDRWTSLQRITPEDVTDFYDRYYVPEAMTLVVIGDLERREVLEVAERTLGSLRQRPVAPTPVAAEDAARQRATYYWGFGPNVRYTARYKLYNGNTKDDLMVLFMRDLLRRRLNQRLRYGEQKAVYGIQVSTTQRGPGGFLQIEGSIAADEYDFAQETIQEEIATLRDGSAPPEQFEADRTALVERLRGENTTAQALNFWVLREFYDPTKHTDFPDILSFFAGVSQDEVAAFAERVFEPEREVTTLVAVQPLSQGMLALIVLALVFLTVRAVAWTLKRPVTMPGILYVARFRVPLPLQIALVAGFAAAGLIVGRVIVFLVQSLALTYVVTAAEYSIQLVFYGGMLIAAVALGILYLSRFPRKLLVFPDHIRIKYLAYRSRILKPDDLLEISTRRMHQVWLRKELFQCVPLTLGIVGPGIYLRPHKGRAYFFRSRNTGELSDVLGGWRGSSVLPAKLPSRRKKVVAVARDKFREAQETSSWIASIATDFFTDDDKPPKASVSDPLPGLEGPSDSIALDPPPGLDEPSDSVAMNSLPGLEDASASVAADPLPGLEGSSDSVAPDPPPGLEDASASVTTDPLPEPEEPAPSIGSLAPDSTPEEAGEDAQTDDGKSRIKELLLGD